MLTGSFASAHYGVLRFSRAKALWRLGDYGGAAPLLAQAEAP